MEILKKKPRKRFYSKKKRKKFFNKYNIIENYKNISKNIIKNYSVTNKNVLNLLFTKNNIIEFNPISKIFDKKLLETKLNDNAFKEKNWKQTYIWPMHILKKRYSRLAQQKKELKTKKLITLKKIYNINKNRKSLNKKILYKIKFYKLEKKKYDFFKNEYKKKKQLIKVLNEKQTWIKYFIKKLIKFNNKKLKLIIKKINKIQNKC